MNRNRQIWVLLSIILVFGILLCGFAIDGNYLQNNAKSTLNFINIDNTFANIREKRASNIEIMPYSGEGDETPSVLPDQTEEEYRELASKNSKNAKRNLMVGKIVVEQTSKRVLYGENENEKLYPASTTKVLTALCVLNNLPLDRVVTVPKIAEGVEGSSIYLKAGQKITVEDLLFGLMLRSGNDAAVTLAVETSGSIENFARLMNETAKECGAKNSNFVNPHGLHDENHYTTAYDLAQIAAKAYENDDFVRIASSKLKKIKVDDVETVIANKNKMLKLYDGANGVKTGFTKASGRCLVSGAKQGGMQLISVVLNCGDMWNESVRLLDFGFDNYEMVSIERAMLSGGATLVEASITTPVNGDWSDVRFPMKRDGSEKLVLR